jgi:hypothetical protein
VFSSPQAEVQDCGTCAGTGFLEAVRFGPTGAFERDRPCDYCGATGKQPPAEPQEVWCPKCRKRITPTIGDECPDCGSFQYTEDPESRRSAYGDPAEPQGDVVENEKAVELLAERLYRFAAIQQGWSKRWPDLLPSTQNGYRNDARCHLEKLTPLLALEVRERLEGFLDSPAFLDHLRAGGKRRRDVLDAFFGAFTPAPSEPVMRCWKLVGLGKPFVPHVLRGPNLPNGEPIEVVPLSEVREALLGPDAIEAVRTNRDREDEEHKGESRIIYVRGQNIGADLAAAFDAAFASTDSEGQG